MRKSSVAFLILSALLIGANSVQAQRYGAQVDWGTDTDLGLGARLEYDLGPSLASEGTLTRAYFIGSFDLFFPNVGNYFEFNGNLVVPVNPASTLNPYVGGGLNMAHSSNDSHGNTDLALNLLGGLRFAVGKLSSFGEARLELGHGDQLVLTYGVLFSPNQ